MHVYTYACECVWGDLIDDASAHVVGEQVLLRADWELLAKLLPSLNGFDDWPAAAPAGG